MTGDLAGLASARSLAAIGIILAAAGVIRVWQIDESLWLDELHTAWVITTSPAEIAERAKIGNQSPLYFWLPAITTRVFGSTELSIRLPSLVAGLAMIPLAFGILYRWTDSLTAAGCAAALIALDARCIFYSQEARPYALVQGVALLHIYQFWKLQQQPTRVWRAAAVGTAILLFWLHYTSVLLFTAEGVWYLSLMLWRRTTYRFPMLTIDTFLFGLGVLPAVGHLIAIASRRSQWNSFIGQDLLTVASGWFSLLPYVLCPLFLTAIACIDIAIRSHEKPRSPPCELWALVICWFTVPVTLAWTLTWFDVTRLFFPRYLVGCLVAPIALAGMTVAVIPKRPARIAVAVSILGLSVFHSGIFAQFLRDGRFLSDRSQDWRGAITWLNQEAQGQLSPLFIRSGLIEADQLSVNQTQLFRDYCILPLTSLYPVAEGLPHPSPLPTHTKIQLPKTATAEIDRRAAVWLVINGNVKSRGRTVEEFILAAREGGIELQRAHQRLFGGVLVISLEVVR